MGGGNLATKLQEHGYEVYSTDLYDRGYGEFGIDFLQQTQPFDGDIITNPPYKLATEFVLKALELTQRKVAMFLKIQFLESQKRWDKLFSKYPPSVIYVFVKRINCYPNNIKNNKSSAVCYAWYIWDKENDEETKIRWLK